MKIIQFQVVQQDPSNPMLKEFYGLGDDGVIYGLRTNPMEWVDIKEVLNPNNDTRG